MIDAFKSAKEQEFTDAMFADVDNLMIEQMMFPPDCLFYDDDIERKFTETKDFVTQIIFWDSFVAWANP